MSPDRFDGSITLLTCSCLRTSDFSIEKHVKTLKLNSYSLLHIWISLSLSLQILVIDAWGRNYWTANPTPIYGIKDVKRPLQLLPRPEYDWIKQRRTNLMRLSENTPSPSENIKDMNLSTLPGSKTLWSMCRKWMKMDAGKVSALEKF